MSLVREDIRAVSTRSLFTQKLGQQIAAFLTPLVDSIGEVPLRRGGDWFENAR